MALKLFRPGQWVKFNLKVNGAHRSRDGLTVGIYRKAYVDALGQAVPEAIVPVTPSGENILVVVGGTPVPLAYPLNQLPGLVPVLSRDDVPAARIKNSPDWQPTP